MIQPTEIYHQLNLNDKRNTKQIANFIEFILHWSTGDQKMPTSFLILFSSNQREVFIVNISAFDIVI